MKASLDSDVKRLGSDDFERPQELGHGQEDGIVSELFARADPAPGAEGISYPSPFTSVDAWLEPERVVQESLREKFLRLVVIVRVLMYSPDVGKNCSTFWDPVPLDDIVAVEDVGEPVGRRWAKAKYLGPRNISSRRAIRFRCV